MKQLKLNDRIIAFVYLGKEINAFLNGTKNEKLSVAIIKSKQQNSWFTDIFISYALEAIANMLKHEELERWLKNYMIDENIKTPKRIAVAMAGNIPAVGFHDFLCVLISGNKFIGKLSSKDKYLLPVLAKMLIIIEPRFIDYIQFTENTLPGFDAVIATGSNNTARYFEYYFGSYPHIIRKNRKSIAIITGDETPDMLEKLADDIFIYFGLGCRNVSKLYIPEKYDFSIMLNAFMKYRYFTEHSKYFNNYEYYKAIFIIDKIQFLDAGFFILKQDTALGSPVSVINYEYYNFIAQIENDIQQLSNSLQCIISSGINMSSHIFGSAQMPDVSDYADGVDTMSFLLYLSTSND